MKMLNKTLVAGAILAFAAFGSAYADEGLSFENEISTDTYYFGDDTSDYRRFPGITEKMAAEYSGEKVDAKVELHFDFFGYNDDRWNAERLRYEKKSLIGLTNLFFDGYIKFRPIEIIQIALDDKEFASGSYFPILDSNVDLGNYTGDFGLLIKPMTGLSIGAGVNLASNILNDRYPDDPKIFINFGAEYEFENIGSFALTFNDVVNEFGFGAFAKITAVPDLTIYGGIAYQDEHASIEIPSIYKEHYYYSLTSPYAGSSNPNGRNLTGDILINAAAEYKGIDKLYLAAELATNCFAKLDWQYDLYTGLKAGYEINDMFSINGTSYLSFDFVDDDDDHDYCYDPLLYFYPEAVLKIGNHTFKAGVKLEFSGDYFIGSIPLSWTYAF